MQSHVWAQQLSCLPAGVLAAAHVALSHATPNTSDKAGQNIACRVNDRCSHVSTAMHLSSSGAHASTRNAVCQHLDVMCVLDTIGAHTPRTDLCPVGMYIWGCPASLLVFGRLGCWPTRTDIVDRAGQHCMTSYQSSGTCMRCVTCTACSSGPQAHKHNGVATT